MNIYIDFDNTLYETAKLTELMLEAIAKNISKKSKILGKDILEEEKKSFDSTNDNIYTFAEKMALKYNVNSNEVINAVERVVDNSENLVFDDAENFLMKLKANNYKVYLLTYTKKSNKTYQMQKIIGSGLVNYFDGIIITNELKFTLDLDYSNGIFIDDDPRDLEGLLKKKPLKVIRIRKPNNKRSKIDINIDEIEEYKFFDDINLDF